MEKGTSYLQPSVGATSPRKQQPHIRGDLTPKGTPRLAFMICGSQAVKKSLFCLSTLQDAKASQATNSHNCEPRLNCISKAKSTALTHNYFTEQTLQLSTRTYQDHHTYVRFRVPTARLPAQSKHK